MPGQSRLQVRPRVGFPSPLCCGCDLSAEATPAEKAALVNSAAADDDDDDDDDLEAALTRRDMDQ